MKTVFLMKKKNLYGVGMNNIWADGIIFRDLYEYVREKKFIMMWNGKVFYEPHLWSVYWNRHIGYLNEGREDNGIAKFLEEMEEKAMYQ